MGEDGWKWHRAGLSPLAQLMDGACAPHRMSATSPTPRPPARVPVTLAASLLPGGEPAQFHTEGPLPQFPNPP